MKVGVLPVRVNAGPVGGDPSALIAVSGPGFQQAFKDQACEGVPCDSCIVQYPQDAVPLCNDQGHCEVGFIN